MVDLFRYRHWDLVGKRGLYYIISGLMLLCRSDRLVHPSVSMKASISRVGDPTPTILPAVCRRPKGRNYPGSFENKLKAAGIDGTVVFSPSKDANVSDQILVHTLLKGDEKADNLSTAATQVTDIANAVTLEYLPDSPGFPATGAASADTKAATAAAVAGKNVLASATATTVGGQNAAASATATTVAGNNAANSATASTMTATTAATGKAAPPASSSTKMVVKLDSKETVSGTISDELTRNAIAATFLGSCLILLWIWFRYNIAASAFAMPSPASSRCSMTWARWSAWSRCCTSR